eukprot:TRINITY_DN39799_c0_g1_i1.p1 TRINITY_DN39799_c0_g1~~TRINITY_DN39799_c0_g1_i1.p1  ORF type:complete len:358 (+),score=61.00 TRINITY_DN39799_c0_g1_i1:165-1238(+)
MNIESHGGDLIQRRNSGGFSPIHSDDIREHSPDIPEPHLPIHPLSATPPDSALLTERANAEARVPPVPATASTRSPLSRDGSKSPSLTHGELPVAVIQGHEAVTGNSPNNPKPAVSPPNLVADCTPDDPEAISLDQFRDFFSSIPQREPEARQKRRWKASQTMERAEKTPPSPPRESADERQEEEDNQLVEEVTRECAHKPAPQAATAMPVSPKGVGTFTVSTAVCAEEVTIVIKDPRWTVQQVVDKYSKYAPQQFRELPGGFEFVYNGCTLPMGTMVQDLVLESRQIMVLAIPRGAKLEVHEGPLGEDGLSDHELDQIDGEDSEDSDDSGPPDLAVTYADAYVEPTADGFQTARDW